MGVAIELITDANACMKDCGVVLAPEELAHGFECEVGLFSQEIHCHLARERGLLVTTAAFQGLFINGEVR